jgi:hypothetical protein
MSVTSRLSFVDEHTVPVEAEAGHVWRAVENRMLAPSGAAAGVYGRLIGVRGGRAFEVAHREPPYRLVLVGEHRFARYSLTFNVYEVGPGRCSLSAQTSAAFPGIAGRLYRAAVIGSRAHILVVRRLLERIAQRAERSAVMAGRRPDPRTS